MATDARQKIKVPKKSPTRSPRQRTPESPTSWWSSDAEDEEIETLDLTSSKSLSPTPQYRRPRNKRSLFAATGKDNTSGDEALDKIASVSVEGGFWDDDESSQSSRESWRDDDMLDSSNHSQRVNAEYDSQDPGSEEDSEVDDDCVITYEIISSQGLSKQPWTVSVKKELTDDDEVPDLTFSQDTAISANVDKVDSPRPGLGFSRSAWLGIDKASDSLPLPKTSLKKSSVAERDHNSLPNPDNPQAIVFEDEINWDERLPTEKRKHLFYRVYWHMQRAKLEKLVSRYHNSIQGEKTANGCWLYDRPCMTGGRSLSMKIQFKHDNKIQALSVSTHFVTMLLKGLLTSDHIEGIVNHGWNASHLCGNWTCMNPAHIYPEPWSVNISRNPCFKDRFGLCDHQPQCKKYLKLDLEYGRPVKPKNTEDTQVAPDDPAGLQAVPSTLNSEDDGSLLTNDQSHDS